MINRTLNDMAEELFMEIVKTELRSEPRELRNFDEGNVINMAHAARRLAGIYFKEMYGADESD